MKASDDLKLFCADPYTGWVPREKQQDELRKIAARAEEVEQRAEELEHALVDAHAGLAQWHDRAVMLPTDAEGVPFRVGDVVEYGNSCRERISYLILHARKGGIEWGIGTPELAAAVRPASMRHAQADTFDMIISDAVNSDAPDIDALVKRCERVAALGV